jgi:hypothetical protein
MNLGGKSYRDYSPPTRGLDGLSGFNIKNPNCQHSTQFLGWEKGATLFRIYPMFEPGGSGGVMRELPWRINEEQSNFTLWMVACRIAKMMGVNDKFTCITNVKGADPRDLGPIDRFSDTMIRAIDKSARSLPEEWERWVKGRAGQGAKIPRVENFGLVQGMLFESAGKVFKGQDGRPKPLHPALLCLSKSARIALQMACNAEVQGYAGNPEDYNGRFQCGDFLSCKGGRYVRFFHVPRAQNTNPHYGVEFLTPCPLPEALVAREWTPWEKLLSFSTKEEQLGILVAHFPPEPLDYVFRDTEYREMLPRHVPGTFARMMATQVAPGGYSPAGYPAAPPPGYAPAAPPQGYVPPAGYPAAPVPPATGALPPPPAALPAAAAYVPPAPPYGAPVAQPLAPAASAIDFGEDELPVFDAPVGAAAPGHTPLAPPYSAPPTGAVAAGQPMVAWTGAAGAAPVAPVGAPVSQPNGDPLGSARMLDEARNRLRGVTRIATAAGAPPQG